MQRILLSLLAAGVCVGGSTWAAGPDNDKDARTDKSSPSSATKSSETPRSGTNPKTPAANPALEEVQRLRQLVQEEAERLRGLQQRLTDVEGQLAGGEPASTNAASAPTATTQPPPHAELAAASAHPLAEPPSAATQENDKGQEKKPFPLYFEIGKAKFTPGGFVDLTEFTRTTNLGSGIATAFGALPYNNTQQGRLTETRFSAQYSRLSLKVDAPVTDATSLTGYVEADFLGFQPANAYITSNSNSLRMRVYWANVKHGNWEVLAGQEWSLLTPNRVGLSPYTPDVFYTFNEDPNFQVGLIWARQAQARAIYHVSDKLAVGVSAENPQQIAPASVVFPAITFMTQFDNTSSATNAPSASTNTFVPNLHPDVIVKVAYDTQLGRRPFHAELAGLVRSFKVFDTLVTPNRTNTITGGGGSFNFNLQMVRNLTLVANSFYSDGGGRYNQGLGPDAIVKANGALSAVHSGAGLGGLEWQATRRYMFDAYYGAAYFKRNFGLFPTPGTTCNGLPGFSCIGFGFPGSANTSNRAIQEATFDIIPTLWSSENYGKFQVITQYSYLKRSPWSTLTIPPTPKNAHLSMVYAGIRYTLP